MCAVAFSELVGEQLKDQNRLRAVLFSFTLLCVYVCKVVCMRVGVGPPASSQDHLRPRFIMFLFDVENISNKHNKYIISYIDGNVTCVMKNFASNI